MLKFWGTLLLACLFMVEGAGQSYGLQFSSHEVVPEKRTALNLTPNKPLCFKEDAEIDFDFRFRPNLETYFGYIVRIIADGTGSRRNIDIVYNQILRNFNFVIGENSNVFELDSATLHSKWNNIRIRFDKKAQKVFLYVNDSIQSQHNLRIDNQVCLKILFGINDSEGYQTVDLPPMHLRNIRIFEGKDLKHSFTLAESNGTIAADSLLRERAIVRNPHWIKPRHQVWDEVSSFSTAGAASVAFDEKNEILYIIARDSLFLLSVKSGEMSSARLATGRMVLPPGNQSVYNTDRGELVNFYVDEKQVSIFNSKANKWNLNFSTELLTEYWHANKFISPVDSSLYIVGGYGQLRYKNSIFRYRFATQQWDTLQPSGDFLMPRYLSAIGLNASRDTAYILGGYGSNTGDQKINPKHSYDLMAYAIRSGTLARLQQLQEPSKHFAFGNSLITDSATREYYSLVYARDRFNSFLQLLQGSLDSPSYRFVGDTIPYLFHDIESFADLFYAPASKKLFAVTLFTGKDTVSTVRIYSLDFPPNQLTDLSPSIPPEHGPQVWIWVIIVSFVLLVVAAYLVMGKTRYKGLSKRRNDLNVRREEMTEGNYTPPGDARSIDPAHSPPKIPARNSIYLFGQFHVTDMHGNDITRQFTPLLKELFLLILIHSAGDHHGISSEALTEILWNSKSEKDAKNNRSVNIAKLKGVVEKMGTPVITKESGMWQFQVNDSSVYVDFGAFNELIKLPAIVDRPYIAKLLNIASRGTFLWQTDYNWLDDIKSSVSNTVIDRFVKYLEKANVQDEAEFLIDICNCIFHFDRLNEQALEYKCKSLIILKRHALANTTYLNFVREYKEIYQEDFIRTFNEVIR